MSFLAALLQSYLLCIDRAAKALLSGNESDQDSLADNYLIRIQLALTVLMASY